MVSAFFFFFRSPIFLSKIQQKVVINLDPWSSKIINSSLKTEDNLEVVKAIPLDRIMLETGA
jgi:Tat protein secretion system quality control protein TatD with DNase activity